MILAWGVVAEDVAGEVGAVGLGEVFPLGEPEVGVLAGFLAGEGEFFGVGDAIYPNDAFAEEFADTDGEEAGGGAGGDDDVGLLG